MPKIYLHDTGGNFVAITNGEKGQVSAIPKRRASDIQKLIDERDRIGKQLTARLKREGIVAESDETTEVIEPGG